MVKSIIFKAYPVAAIFTVLTGLGLFITAFFTSNIQIQVALGLGGVALVSLSLIIIKLTQEAKQAQVKLDTIMARLDGLQQELEKKEEPKSGIAIADIINSSLKFYADYKDREKGEE